ncbi:putative DNA-binding ribbon-helix-helix protein [Tepidamorphus gemmatus]|uniref:Putative DNA-binding ribbon-helix-helix protein n=1 Tax=Tepidamorphus gemmatus TaxID=747076 RepID=A0A4R3M6Y2_9HYPH|nr:ribbon-helix-helix domain-containing protein [Tepidamorphus gemmatus]TCT08353.1 putative DNA-binding ribbon-helix-helix protein [Tepidamorphus gemmatus]
MSAGQRKRSITIAGHRTSISLEGAFWEALGEIAGERGVPIATVVAEIDRARAGIGLSSAIRLHVLDHYRRRARRAAGLPG